MMVLVLTVFVEVLAPVTGNKERIGKMKEEEDLEWEEIASPAGEHVHSGHRGDMWRCNRTGVPWNTVQVTIDKPELRRRCLRGALIDDTTSNFNEDGARRIHHHRPDRHQKFMEEGPEPESLCPIRDINGTRTGINFTLYGCKETLVSDRMFVWKPRRGPDQKFIHKDLPHKTSLADWITLISKTTLTRHKSSRRLPNSHKRSKIFNDQIHCPQALTPDRLLPLFIRNGRLALAVPPNKSSRKTPVPPRYSRQYSSQSQSVPPRYCGQRQVLPVLLSSRSRFELVLRAQAKMNEFRCQTAPSRPVRSLAVARMIYESCETVKKCPASVSASPSADEEALHACRIFASYFSAGRGAREQGKYNWYELSHGRINIAPTDKDSFLSSPLVAIYQSALSRSFRTGKTSGDFAGGFLYCALSAGVCG
uniref:Uncharacterized protein n=1 Tax=Tenebrio molitor TaxID=7067 RepID=A0A8J6L6H7_TENMO|nr:hypothetical protein GEV33_014554 [Tenebrio molitor]